MAVDYTNNNYNPNFYSKIEKNNPSFLYGKTGYEQYYTDMRDRWREFYNPTPPEDKIDEFYTVGDKKYWTKKIHTDPMSLTFWIDFLDCKGDIDNYNIKKIGDRTKIVNDTTVKSLFYKETPEIVFILPEETV